MILRFLKLPVFFSTAPDTGAEGAPGPPLQSKRPPLLSVPRKISNKKCSPKRSAIKSFRAEVYLPGAIRSHVWLFQSAHEIGLPDFEITSNLRVLLIMNTSVIYENVVVLQMDCDFFF